MLTNAMLAEAVTHVEVRISKLSNIPNSQPSHAENLDNVFVVFASNIQQPRTELFVN